ncbi:MAG: DUF6265 family protein [Acidobacteriota bacterium]
MRAILMLGTLVSALALAVPQAAGGEAADGAEEAVSIDRLSFMAGCWEGDLGGGASIRETFTAPKGGAMFGNSQVVAGGATQFFEFIRVEQTADGIAYRPYPASKETVAFPLARSSATEAVFENPEHDYPQRVSYRLIDDDQLVAQIEKTDGTKVQNFRMTAVPCGGEEHRSALVKGGS